MTIQSEVVSILTGRSPACRRINRNFESLTCSSTCLSVQLLHCETAEMGPIYSDIGCYLNIVIRQMVMKIRS